MKANRIVLALLLAGLASPAFAEKCHICDFSDEPVVVKPTTQTGGGYMDDDVPAGLTAEPTTKEGTFFSKVVGAAKKMAERENEKRRQQQAVGPTPLDAPGGLAATPSEPQASGRTHGTVRIAKEWDSATPQASSSKPKEIVVVGSKIKEPNAPLPAAPAALASPAPLPSRGDRPMESMSLNFTKGAHGAPAAAGARR